MFTKTSSFLVFLLFFVSACSLTTFGNEEERAHSLGRKCILKSDDWDLPEKDYGPYWSRNDTVRRFIHAKNDNTLYEFYGCVDYGCWINHDDDQKGFVVHMFEEFDNCKKVISVGPESKKKKNRRVILKARHFIDESAKSP